MNTLINAIKNNTYENNKLKFQDNLYIKELFEALKTNNTITSLDLRDNSLTEEDIKLLSEALKTNISITSLNLSYNKINVEGIFK